MNERERGTEELNERRLSMSIIRLLNLEVPHTTQIMLQPTSLLTAKTPPCITPGGLPTRDPQSARPSCCRLRPVSTRSTVSLLLLLLLSRPLSYVVVA